MAKKQDFASKTQKMARHGKSCPVCGEYYTYVKSVNMINSDKPGAFRFEEKNIPVCKCNEQEVYS